MFTVADQQKRLHHI